MKFENSLTARSTIKKMKEYDFPELTEQDIIEGRKRPYDNLLLVLRKGNVLGLYTNKDGKLVVTFFHSYNRFTELEGVK